MKDFSKISALEREYYSDVFQILGMNWNLLIYPSGNGVDYLRYIFIIFLIFYLNPIKLGYVSISDLSDSDRDSYRKIIINFGTFINNFYMIIKLEEV